MRTAIVFCLLAATAGATKRSPRLRDSKERGEAVPHILHQSWKDAHVPEMYTRWVATWKTLHPTWEYRCALLFIWHNKMHALAPNCCVWVLDVQHCLCRLWTDADNDAFVSKYYPWCAR